MTGDDVITGRVTPANQGYVTSVLDGIWSRAPYLHNGSVPTLYHLLVPSERPQQFLRGSIDYDQAMSDMRGDCRTSAASSTSRRH